MKVTATKPEEMIRDVQHYSKGKNLTQCLRIALSEWIAQKKLRS